MTNYEKRDRYIELNETLSKALEQEFYYEAIFIEHAILEDRVISLFKHANLNMPFQLGAKLEKIKTNEIFKDEYISKHIDMELLDKVNTWRDKRNKMVHNLIESSFNNEDIKEIAIEGNEVIKKFASKTTLVTRYLDKQMVTE